MADKIVKLEKMLAKETKRHKIIQMRLSDSLADTKFKLNKAETMLEKQ